MTVGSCHQATDGVRADSNTSTYRRYLLAVLVVILAFNFSDRLAFGIALQNIKTDLRLSDTQLGFVTGIAFAFFHAIMGVPIARWADRGNRVSIISITVAMWSVMVAVTGRVVGFVQLLCVRSAVAVGEAGCVPPANSMIADHYSRAERPKATGIYMTGMYLSVVIGYFIGGWLNQLYGWRIMFMLLGVPGVILALVAKLTLREPRLTDLCPSEDEGMERIEEEGACRSRFKSPGSPVRAPSMREVCAALWTNATFRHLVCCFSVLSFFSAGIGQWQPAYFIRSYHLSTGELGTWLAVIGGLGGFLGVNLGGVLGARYAPSNEGAQFRAMAVASAALAVIWSGIYLAPNYHASFALMGVGTLGFATFTGPLYGAIQSLVHERMRATAIAIVVLFANLIGAGLGPLMVGMLSEALHHVFGEESLRWALLAMCPGYIWAGWHLWRASRTISGDIEALRPSLSQARRSHALNPISSL